MTRKLYCHEIVTHFPWTKPKECLAKSEHWVARLALRKRHRICEMVNNAAMSCCCLYVFTTWITMWYFLLINGEHIHSPSPIVSATLYKDLYIVCMSVFVCLPSSALSISFIDRGWLIRWTHTVFSGMPRENFMSAFIHSSTFTCAIFFRHLHGAACQFGAAASCIQCASVPISSRNHFENSKLHVHRCLYHILWAKSSCIHSWRRIYVLVDLFSCQQFSALYTVCIWWMCQHKSRCVTAPELNAQCEK